MIKLDLNFWFNKGQSIPLIRLCQKWWENVELGLRWPMTQLDPMTCTLQVLNMIAWQRDIDRFATEPLWLYRARVKFAYVNARDAGSIVGIKRIFMRLGIGYVEVDERVDGKDWDVIVLRLTDSQLAQNAELLKILIEKYGRTCRRYEFETINAVSVDLATIEFDNSWSFDVASF
jgi:hypothetical protein